MMLPAPALPVEEVAPATQTLVQPKRARSTRAQRSRRALVLVTLALLAVCFVMMSPFIWTAMSALKPTRVAFANPPVFFFEPTIDAFVRLWETTDFAFFTMNTLIIGVMAVVGTLFLAAPAAYALARFGGRTSAIILAFALLIRSIPGFAIMLPMYDFATALGVYDTKIALAVAFVAVDLPFTVWLLRNFFAAIPVELDEAAMIDGCSRWGSFRRVILPLMQPGLVTAGLLTFLLAFQSFLLPVVLADINAQTVPVFLSTQIGQSLPLLQQAAAGIVLLTIPVLVLAVFAQRYLVAGLAAGAVKG
ncbi:carbohydrate ABC transporter permease [Microbacterium sp. HJ5]